MDFLSTTGREYNTRTGAQFTVRPANSLSYSLDRRRPLRNSRYRREEEESRDQHGTRPETEIPTQPKTYSKVEREKMPLKQNQNGTQVKQYERGRTEGRTNLSSRSKSLDWRTGVRSPERKQSYRGDSWRRSGDLGGSEGNRVKSTVQALNNVQDTALSKSRGQSLPSKLTPACLGPKGGQSILQRIEKLYGASEFGNTGDYKTSEPHKDGFGGTFPRRLSAGEHKHSSGQSEESLTSKEASMSNSQGINRARTSGQWQNQNNAGQFSDIGTRSLDRARSRSTLAARIRASRAAEEVDRSVQPESILEGISEVTNKDMERKTWSRTSVRERNPAKTEEIKDKAEEKNKSKKESPSDDVFVASEKLKWIEKKSTNTKSLTASVRNKINQFEALTQRAQSSSPRRAFSMPESISKPSDGVQRSSSARVAGTTAHRWRELREESGQAGAGKKSFLFEREKKLDEGKSINEIKLKPFPETKQEHEKDLEKAETSKEMNKYDKMKTTLELPLIKDSQPTTNLISVDETDFSKIPSPEKVPNASSSSEVSTPTSDNDKTPTSTPDRTPLPSPIVAPQKSPAFEPMDISPPLVTNLPDLISQDNLNGKKRVLDLNAWLEGLNPQVTAWGLDGDDDDDDDSTQRDEDSNYDSDSGESSVTITSVMSNKSFSVSLADLCNFAGADYDSENDSDEWQSTGRRSASLSSDISAFSYVSVMPTEELDKLIEDVKSIGDKNMQDYNDVHVVVLHKDVGVGLGFSLAGGMDQNKPVTVHKVFHSGVAAQEGSIKQGDQVLSINGTALSGFAHWEALRVLRRAKGREMGVVVLKKPDTRASSSGRGGVAISQAPAPAPASEKGLCLSVVLQKNERGLGFSLEGGVGSSLGNKPLSVQKIFQGGPVDQILPGDEIVEVNGVSVVGMRRLEVWTLIRKLPPGPVSVVLRRQSPTLKT